MRLEVKDLPAEPVLFNVCAAPGDRIASESVVCGHPANIDEQDPSVRHVRIIEPCDGGHKLQAALPLRHCSVSEAIVPQIFRLSAPTLPFETWVNL